MTLCPSRFTKTFIIVINDSIVGVPRPAFHPVNVAKLGAVNSFIPMSLRQVSTGKCRTARTDLRLKLLGVRILIPMITRTSNATELPLPEVKNVFFT